MKKKLIFILTISIALILGGVFVFSAFIFNQVITNNSQIGTIEVNKKVFRTYEDDLSATGTDYQKLRVDTVLSVESITFNVTNTTYSETTDEVFMEGTVYYTQSGNAYIEAEVEYGTSIPNSPTYYVQINTYSGINAIRAYNKNGLVEPTISGSTFSFTYNAETITATCDIASTGKVNSVTLSKNTLRAVLYPSGLGMIILDNEITNTKASQGVDGYKELSADNNAKITCSATKKRKNASNIYLSQLSLYFEFSSKMPVYIRIHIQDAWKRTRNYSSSSLEQYILKDQINGISPFTITSNEWIYDEDTNYIYLKEMYVPENEDDVQSYVFYVNEAYFYESLVSNIYEEFVDVEVAFSVDIVQANRAYARWGFDPSEKFGNE